VSIYLNARPAPFDFDGDHVKAARPIVQAMPGQIVYGHLRQSSLLPRSDRLFATTELLAQARLHFNEHRRPLMGGDDVNFSKAGSVATIKNCVPESLELGAREIFTVFSKDLAGIV
jgi:hypothetical protein